MPKSLDKKDIKSYTQEDGVVVVKNVSWHEPTTQLSFSTDSTIGTVMVRVKYHEEADFEHPNDEPLIIDLTNLKSQQFYDVWLHSFEFTPSNVDASYKPCISVGRMYDSL